ncbi:MAG TPA: T9SS type A sorting domain-containing protein [Bacteroidales bacterium]|nr:T9SS type A sorting domain-containing protein [Bacteroidales bacterium]
MKKNLLVILLSFTLSLPAMSQVTLTSSDMPQPGDTLRISMTAQVPGDYSLSGNDVTWDLSSLEPMTQRVESFVPMTNVPTMYQFVFVPSIVANLASPNDLTLPVTGLPVTDSYTFYKNSTDGFYEAGAAMKVSGFPLMLKYNVPDRLYSLPLTNESDWNSSSFAEFSLPGLLYFSMEKNRTSAVDAWGTLITPFGTFNTLRVKSTLVEHDSIAIDTLGVQMPVTRNITEYKWLAPGQGIPVLSVSEEGGMINAVYRDIYRPGYEQMTVNIGNDTAVMKGQSITLTANVTNGVPPFQYIWGNFETTPSITLVVDTVIQTGVVVVDAMNNVALDMITISVKYGPSIQENTPPFLQISPNPSDGLFTVVYPKSIKEGTLTVTDLAGRVLRQQLLSGTSGREVIDLTGSVPGVYFIQMKTGNEQLTGKVIIR